jgi:hypothetical protein
MTLEPLASTKTEDTSELDDMSRRFWITLGLTVPLILVTMGDYLPAINLHRWFGVNSLRWDTFKSRSRSARIVLVHGDLNGIVRARHLSQGTIRNIRENLGFAFIYNRIGVPVAAGVLYPTFGIVLNPMIASAAMALSSVSVITNALRLRRST